MAQDKKGFILYADQKELFDQLPNDKAGELIKHIFSYVNDEDPTTDDLLIKLAFTPIKQQLKRDLKKFEETKKQRSEAGKRSAALRKKQRESTALDSVERSSTKATVKDNVNVNVTVNDKVNDNDVDYVYKYIDTIANDYLKNEKLIKAVIDNKDFPVISEFDLKEKLNDFVMMLKSTDQTTKTDKDFKTHFRNWVKKRKEKSSEQKEKKRFHLQMEDLTKEPIDRDFKLDIKEQLKLGT